MIKVKLLIIIFLNFLLLFAPFGLVKSSLAAIGCETRGTWLNPNAFNSDARRTETLDKILQANLNTVFLASYTLSGNFGWAQQTDFDKFYTMLRQNNISVHVWVSSMDRVSNVDFTNPGERTAQMNWALSWFNRYPDLDGFHLDYIRYDWVEADSAKMNGVTQTVHAIHEGVKAQFPTKLVSAAVFTTMQYWQTEPNSDIPQWFLDWRAGNTGSRYGNMRVPEFFKVNQDPVGWIRNGYLDLVIPMEYTTDDGQWNPDASSWVTFLGEASWRLSMGLGYMKADQYRPIAYDVAGIIRRINYGRSVGVKGFSIFQIGSTTFPTGVSDWDLVNALANGPFNGKVTPCMTTPANMTPTPTPSSCSLKSSGDLNCDGKINESDLNALLGKWMTNEKDITGDGKTNESDLNKLLGNWKAL